MCNFFSCIVMKDKQVLNLEGVHSHTDILEHFSVPDNTDNPELLQFARIEILPPDGNVFEADLSKWTYKVDQDITPDWLSPAHRAAAFAVLEEYRKDHIFQYMEFKELKDIKDVYLKNCTVQEMHGNSVVQEMHDNSVVQEMHGYSVVRRMYNNSVVQGMDDNSIVQRMEDNSVVQEMHDNSVVQEMHDNSVVQEMYGYSVVRRMHGDSVVRRMYSNSVVQEMDDNSVVQEMHGYSVVTIYSSNVKYTLKSETSCVLDRCIYGKLKVITK